MLGDSILDRKPAARPRKGHRLLCAGSRPFFQGPLNREQVRHVFLARSFSPRAAAPSKDIQPVHRNSAPSASPCFARGQHSRVLSAFRLPLACESYATLGALCLPSLFAWCQSFILWRTLSRFFRRLRLSRRCACSGLAALHFWISCGFGTADCNTTFSSASSRKGSRTRGRSVQSSVTSPSRETITHSALAA